jgi:hypothetical protein
VKSIKKQANVFFLSLTKNNMLIENKVEKAYEGPPVFVAYLFLLTGLFIVPLNRFSLETILIGGFLIIASCFFIFSLSGVKIDTDKRKIKQYNKIFGIIENGTWQHLDDYLGVTLVPVRKVQGMASWSNQTTTTSKTTYRIFLVNKAKKPAFAIKSCKTIEQAQDSLDEFSIWLKMPVFSIKR